MIDVRPAIPEDIDLTELGIFSGYRNRHSAGRTHVDKHDMNPSALDRLKNFELIGFQSFCDTEDRRYVKLCGTKKKSDQTRDLKILYKRSLSDCIRGKCEVCETSHNLPILVRILYPRVYTIDDLILYLDASQMQCMKCCIVDIVDKFVGDGMSNISYKISSNSSTSYEYTTSWSTNGVLTYDNETVYELISKMIEQHDHLDISTLHKHPNRVYFLKQLYHDITNDQCSANSYQLVKHLNEIVETMEEIWSPNVTGLRHSLGFRNNTQSKISLSECHDPFSNYMKHDLSIIGIVLSKLSRQCGIYEKLFKLQSGIKYHQYDGYSPHQNNTTSYSSTDTTYNIYEY